MPEPRKINLVRIAHAYYKHSDLGPAENFVNDFGFFEISRAHNPERIYYRGYGTEPFVLCLEKADKSAFGGVSFVVESEDDLTYASETLPGATEVYQLKDAPGGGKCVTFYDPLDGFPFHLVHGQTPAEAIEPHFPHVRVNYPLEKNRPVNRKQRFEKRPAPIHKLGHFGVCVTDFAKAFEFYSSRFNLFPSELIHTPDGKDVTVFYRLNRGKEPVDHHCFFFFEGPEYHVHHTSYETYDFDAQVLGHDWLRHKGHKSCWGVGRHIMGSQIFDYWFDPDGFIMEHYVDGDLLDDTEETQHTLASPDNLHVWGPDLPPDFLE